MKTGLSALDRNHSPGRFRGGFTLLEMLLACAILLVAFAISWPSISRLYQARRLTHAGEQIQVRLAAARLRAMDGGITYQFRFEPSGQKFLIIPFELSDALLPQASQPVSQGARNSCWKSVGELTGSIKFGEPTMSLPGVQQITAEWLAGLPDQETLLPTQWSAPILFHPDGSANAGDFELTSPDQESVRLTVRPLTGGATVSKVAAGPVL